MNLKPARYLVALVAAAMASTIAAAHEHDERERDEHVITRIGTIDEDLFLYGDSIDIGAEVAGEIIVIGSEVNLSALAKDDVVVIGGEVSVGDEVAGDVIATGGEVTTAGKIGGGVTAMGGEVRLDSTVAGDALVAGGSIVADGVIAGKLRMVGGEVLNRAEVGGSMLAAGGEVTLHRRSRVAGSARLAGGGIAIDGIIGRDLEVWGRNIVLGGDVTGDVTLRGVDILVLSSARIGGDLTYRSAKEAIIHPDAEIAGDVTFIYSEAPERMAGGAMQAFGATWLVFLVSLILLGAVLVLLFPQFAITAARTIGGTPWRSLGLGFALVVAGPFAIVILALTVVGFSLSVISGAVYLAATAFGYLVAAIALGRFGARLIRWNADRTTWGRIAALAAGLVVLSIAALIPVVGVLTTFAAFVFGVGALVLAVYRARAASSLAPSPA